MNIAICDDEAPGRLILKHYLERYATEHKLFFLYSEYTDGEELLKTDQDFDLIFMDFQMKNKNGLETAHMLRKTHNSTPIIFISGYPNIVFDTFEVNAFRFLIKPIDPQKLFSALDKLLSSIGDDNYIIIKSDSITQRLNLNDIIYVEAENTHCCIRLANETIIYKKTLSDFENLLHTDCFFRCHRSYLVNFQHVASYSEQYVIMDNKEKALLSKMKRAPFKQAFQDYIFKLYRLAGK